MKIPMIKIFSLLILIVLVGLILVFFWYKKAPPSKTISNPHEQTQTIMSTNPAKSALITEPIINAKTRITKKPFGIYITPENSPIKLERFSGYHTGSDFEATNEELSQTIVVSALCEGEILVKQWISGYGGVIVQNCTVNDEAVTVLYGHLGINENNTLVVGSSIKTGERLAILGTTYSHDTDGERKHLHLGVHRGTAIDYRGYVQNKDELPSWIDAGTFL